MYFTPPPESPIPHLLQEMASRWCHRFVCLVLTIYVYAKTLIISAVDGTFEARNLELSVVRLADERLHDRRGLPRDDVTAAASTRIPDTKIYWTGKTY